MIDTKIACQCGNRFKFGMDLVNGRVPDGLLCPNCSAPATTACNALVDFLSGKEPTPPSTGTRPLKEVKVTCACGSRYKFDLELAEREMPAPVTCPSCQVDLTPIANEEIRNYPAKHAPRLVVAAAAPAPVAAPVPAEPAGQPVLPAPPVAAVPFPTPASSISTEPTPPGADTAGNAVVTDPFGPAPAGKSSGPNLKPLEVPKQVRQPPGTKPAAPPAKSGTPAASTPASATKTGAPKPVEKSPTRSSEPNIGLGIAGAAIGSIIGAVLWFVVLKSTAAVPLDPKSTPFTTTWMAIVLGVLAGVGARLLGRTKAPALGGASCVCASVFLVVMAQQAMNGHIDQILAPQVKSQYNMAFTNAVSAVKATDAELKIIIARNTPSAAMDGRVNVSDEAVTAYRTTQLPALRNLAAGKPSRESWEAAKRSTMRSHYPGEDAWQDSIGILGLLFLLAGMLAAAKIPML